MKHFEINNTPKINPGFTVPESYFDHFPEVVMQKINENNKITPLISYRKWWIAAAAVIVLSLGIFNVYQTKESQGINDQAALESYLVTYSNFADEDFTALLDETDIQKLKINFDISDTEIENTLIQNSNLEQYLIN